MSDVFEEATSFANRFMNNYEKAIAAMPRIAVTSLPRRYSGRCQITALLSRPATYYANYRYRRLTTRSKALCANYGHAAAGTRAVLKMDHDTIEELPHRGKMHVKTTHTSRSYCAECAKRWYKIDADEASEEWQEWQRPEAHDGVHS